MRISDWSSDVCSSDLLRLLHDQTLGSLEQRMATTLAHLARIHGIEVEGGIEVGLRLPQEQLGAMLGVTRQSVNRVLRDMARAGVIDIDYNRITIRDARSAAHTSELQSLMRISYSVFCLKKTT